MKMKFYTGLQILIIFKAIIIILFGCSKDSNAEIIMWNYDNEESDVFISKEIEDFNSNNGNIRVDYSNKDIKEILNELNKKSPKVNLIRCPSEYLYDIKKTNSIIKSDKIFEKEFFEKFLEQAVLSATIDLEIYGIPDNYGNNLILYYNKSLIKKAPQTINELIKYASKLSKSSKEQYGLVFDYYNPRFIQPWWNAFGAEIITEDGDINFKSRENKDTFLFIYKLKYDYNVMPDFYSYSESKKWFTDGKTGFFIDDFKNYAEYKVKLNENLGICLFPKLKKNGKRASSWASSYCYIVVKNLDNNQRDAVKIFIETMTSKKMQYKWLDLNRFPSLKVVDDKMFKTELDLKLRESMLTASAKPDSKKVELIYNSLRPYIEDMMRNKISPDVACEKAQEYLDNKKY